MKSTNFMDPNMTIDAAHDYASRLVELEQRGSSDTEGALYRLEQRYGISPHQLLHLRSRRAKSCDVSLFAQDARGLPGPVPAADHETPTRTRSREGHDRC